MTIKCKLMVLVLMSIFSKNGMCQVNKASYSSFRKTADSIVKLFYGQINLSYIKLDSNKSFYGTLKLGGVTYTKFTENLSYEPEMFCFLYYFRHPAFKGDTLRIRF
jgi:hypothetical protein